MTRKEKLVVTYLSIALVSLLSVVSYVFILKPPQKLTPIQSTQTDITQEEQTHFPNLSSEITSQPKNANSQQSAPLEAKILQPSTNPNMAYSSSPVSVPVNSDPSPSPSTTPPIPSQPVPDNKISQNESRQLADNFISQFFTYNYANITHKPEIYALLTPGYSMGIKSQIATTESNITRDKVVQNVNEVIYGEFSFDGEGATLAVTDISLSGTANGNNFTGHYAATMQFVRSDGKLLVGNCEVHPL